MTLEVLHRPLMLLGSGASAKGAEIAAPAGARAFPARIESVFARDKFANHGITPRSRMTSESAADARGSAPDSASKSVTSDLNC
jgi:hypothetical protein